MDKEQRLVVKTQLVAGMQEGYSWHEAAAKAGLQTRRSNAYRLWLAVRHCGETALKDGRHGHPIKLRGVARALLEEQCQQAPHIPSSTLQAELQERFDLSVSISQINRVRAALGLSNHPSGQKQEKTVRAKGASRYFSIGFDVTFSPVCASLYIELLTEVVAILQI